MAKFVFQLETVLRHRQRVEHDWQRAVAIAQREKASVQNEIRLLDESVRAALADLRANHLTGTLDLSFLAAHRRFMMVMQKQGLSLMATLADRRKRVEAVQAGLAEATKQKKILVKLKERQQERWAAALAKREMAAADEVAMQMSYSADAEGSP